MQKQNFTHTVNFPPLTDLGEFLGMYHNLFMSMGINCGNKLVEGSSNFTHPIAEENAKLVADFSNTYQILSVTNLNTPLTLEEVKVIRSTVIFIFSF